MTGGWLRLSGLWVAVLLGTATLCWATGAPDPDQLILVASAETRGQVSPCSCPHQPRGGLAHRGALLDEVSATAPLHIFVEQGDVFPGHRKMDDPLVWARTLGQAYGHMGYDLVILGEQDVSLGVDVVESFIRHFLRENPEGTVAYPQDDSGFMILDLTLPQLEVACVVLWPPVDVGFLEESLLMMDPSPDLTLGFLDGSVVDARKLTRHLQSLDLLVVGDGAKFEEIQWTDGIPTAGPGTRGKTLSFARFSKGSSSLSWGLAAYRLIGVGDHLGADPGVGAIVEPLVQARSLSEHPEQAGFLTGE